MLPHPWPLLFCVFGLLVALGTTSGQLTRALVQKAVRLAYWKEDHMRPTTTTAIAVLALASAVSLSSSAKAAEPLHIEVCPSRDKAEQVTQSNGSLSPGGCRTVTVTRVDSPTGPMCAMKFGESKSGIVGQITSAVETTEWWTACSNLRAP